MSRLECKGIFSATLPPAEFIRICPDWNVKFPTSTPASQPNKLEYVQIGM